jgi:microcystin-dependent protein
VAVEGTTKNYGWVKPVIQGSPSTWGGFLNTDLDAIDALVFANQQGISPVGQGALWFTNTPPANWLLCQGQSLPHQSGGAYEALFAVIGYQFGGSGANFNLPNLQGRFPFGVTSPALPGAAGGAFAVTLATANLPAHAHPITDVAHNHTINQSVHGHGDPGHTHGVNDPGHAHTVPRVLLGSGVNIEPGSGFNQVTDSGTTSNASNISIQAAGTGIQPANANISLNASGTGLSTTQSIGSGAAFNVVPPYITINFIIRYQ